MRHERLPANFGKPWSDAEDRELLAAFGSEKTLEFIANKHGRTQSSCRLRLEKLGAIEPGSQMVLGKCNRTE